ncbi:MAG: (d)CMP kinase [Planctomycetota bacterium]|nr:(d)CMP kinase [Planctomycetota bacterium]
MIIAIDGPAASGKSTVAQRVAAALGVRFLDTGSMYRAVTWRVQVRDLDVSDEDACGAVAEGLELTFDAAGRIQLDGEPGEPHIRSAEVNRDVSVVAAHPRVRRAVVAMQRAIARGYSVVAEGRDTTTIVFPEAEHKFFLIASPLERARRRAEQEGAPERTAQYVRDLARRDELDSTRADSPLREAEDAMRIDTDGRTVDEVVTQVLEHIGR